MSAAVKAGNDLNCGPQFANLVNASLSGFISDAEIDVAVTRLLRRRVQVGDLDEPPSMDPYASIPYSVVDSDAHRAFARSLVAEGTVLLHNAPGSALPLTRGKTYLVIGPSADDESVQALTAQALTASASPQAVPVRLTVSCRSQSQTCRRCRSCSSRQSRQPTQPHPIQSHMCGRHIHTTARRRVGSLCCKDLKRWAVQLRTGAMCVVCSHATA